MKLLLDQGLPRSALSHLSRAGILAEHVGNLGLATASDELILQTAKGQHATVVSLDADFHKHLAITRAELPSIIRIRIEGLRGDELAAILVRVLQAAEADLSAGALVSVTPGRIRVRSLPIG
jgi:predicted nuclease of predicted toxin-antitoxin system